MREFWTKLFAFLAPIAALLALPSFVLWRGGELAALDVDDVTARQRAGAPLLFGPAYSDCTKLYKLRSAIAAKAEVMVLGTSRSMQFRSALFLPSTRFYNAGGGAARVGHFREFLRRVPRDAQPKLLIISLDQWFWSAETEAHPEAPFAAQVDTCGNVLGVVQSSWRPIYGDLASGKLDLGRVGRAGAIGLSAQVFGNGFRNDGSFAYGRIMREGRTAENDPDFGFAQSFARIASGGQRFDHTDHVAPELVAELERFLDDAAARHIVVLGFLPPYAPSVLDRMRESGKYGYLAEMMPAMEPLFAARGGRLFDFTDLRPLGVGDEGYTDGIHASERAHAVMLLEMLAKAPELAPHTSREHLEALLARSANPLALDVRD